MPGLPLPPVLPRRPDQHHRRLGYLLPRRPAVELDFVPGSAQTALTKPPDQLWGGLLLVRMDPEPRTGPLVVSSGAMRL